MLTLLKFNLQLSLKMKQDFPQQSMYYLDEIKSFWGRHNSNCNLNISS